MIGFLAKRKRGKDTACDYISTQHVYTKRGFADPLKLGIQQWFQFEDDQLYTQKKEEEDKNWGVTPRHVCQVIGTDIVRDLFSMILLPNIGNDFWVKSADIWYTKTMDEHKGNVLWCDVRFQNEVDYILSKGGVVYKIDRPSMDLQCEKTDTHASEKSIDAIKNYTCIINNDGTLDDFYKKLNDIIYK
jgi:hypothetical protein